MGSVRHCCAVLVCGFFVAHLNFCMDTADRQAILTQLHPLVLQRINKFLDTQSKHNFSRTCRYIYHAVASRNPFRRLPQRAITTVAHHLPWADVRALWATSKHLYVRCLDPHKIAVVAGEQFFTISSDSATATEKLISSMTDVMRAIRKRDRTIPIRLDLANQAQRLGIEASFACSLVRTVRDLGLADSIKELDLSGNFSNSCALSLTHGTVAKNPPESVFSTVLAHLICRKLPHLVTLKLNRNELTQLPRSLTDLHQLSTLELAWNYLKPDRISACQFLPHLTSLDLSRNCLNTVPSFLKCMPALQVLDLRGNPLSQEARRSACNCTGSDLPKTLLD